MKTLMMAFTILLGTTSAFAGASDGSSSYTGRYHFTLKNQGQLASRCFRISLHKAHDLLSDKTCTPFVGDKAPLTETIARCGTQEDTFSYIFNTRKACVKAVAAFKTGAK